MKLDIFERIHLLGMLPVEGNAITLRIINELRQDLSFSEKELKDSELKEDPETHRVTIAGGDPQKAEKILKAVVKDVKVGDTGRGIIKEALKKLDDEKKLTLAVMPVYERFMEGNEK